jgi:phospholipid/cholesterol/gamma-HCH transport system substrate-binding protein
MEQLKEQLDQIDKEELWVKISEISDNLNSITASVNKPRKLSETIDNVHLLSERLNRLEQRVEGSWDKVDETMESLQFATENARKISEDGVVIAADAKDFMKTISQGEGTLGRLLNDDDLYLRTTSIMSKAETLMNDINHYGLLFHLNKGWKRTRTKRASNIAALETPSEFRLYFDEELDHINTSLSRVSILLQQADERGAREEIVENSAFADVFLNLMRQVDGLQQSLKYYNENLQEAR